MKTIRQILLIALLSALAAVIQGVLLGPDAWRWAEEGSIAFSRTLLEEDILWVDARSEAAYVAGHLPGSLHLTEDNWDAGLMEVLAQWDPGRTVVVYCDGSGCETSRTVAEQLRVVLGTDGVYWLRGGWDLLQQEEVIQ